ncbi:MAG: hypothetical protein R2729_16520 [Bryobacteraceae bacterium]
MRTCLFALLIATAGRAQDPTIASAGVVNNASYSPSCAASGGIAPGSLFAVFGSNLGPPAIETVAAFPLGASLGGVSVRVNINGTSLEALPLYVSATQVGAILPANAPPGDGTVTVTYRDRTSAPSPIRIRHNAFGIFTADSRGRGQAAVTNASGTGVLRPGDLGILWGTGLGAAPGDEARGPIPGDLANLDVRVWLGDRPARVVYRGRSGCCAGLDQIVFEVPAGAAGCRVPLMVEVDGVPSNFAWAPVGSCGVRAIPDPILSADPNFRLGSIVFLDGFGSVLLPTALDDSVRLGFFQRGRLNGDVEAPLREFEPDTTLPTGTCEVRLGTAFPAQPVLREQSALAAGGEIRIAGEAGAFRMTPNAQNIGRFEDPQRVVLPAGRYRVDNGAGGADVGPFAIDTEAVTLRLTSRYERISRARDLPVTWDWAGPPDQPLTIFGSSRGACGTEQVSFSCTVRAGDRAFSVPARVLAHLPESSQIFGIPNGKLTLVTTAPGGLRRFSARGLDLGVFIHIVISSIQPFYE